MTRNERPTPAELRSLRAYVEAGTIKGAAELTGLAQDTIRGQIASIRSKLGVKSIAQAVYRLHDDLAA